MPVTIAGGLVCQGGTACKQKGRNWWQAATLVLVILAGSWSTLSAQPIPIPNTSFEAPETTYADPRVNAWQKAPKPFWYDESGGFLWDQLVGAFKNTAPGSADHIDNVDGIQAIFLFAVPEVGLFQDYLATDWSNSVPTHAFDARFEVGKSYQLTVGIMGGGGGMVSGATLMVGLYYRDGASNRVTIAATNITHRTHLFPTTTHLVDFQVSIPVVQTGDAWAGQYIGVEFKSIVNPAQSGGYWDIDNVRLQAAGAPALIVPAWTNGQFGFTVQSDPGSTNEILTTTDITSPASWSTVTLITNITGSTLFIDPAANATRRFYRVRQWR